jgi:hypothetical protein
MSRFYHGFTNRQQFCGLLLTTFFDCEKGQPMPKTVFTQNEAIKNFRLGFHLRKKRVGRGIKGSWVAQQMGVSESMLCFLEQGKRNWTDELKAKFLKAIGEK